MLINFVTEFGGTSAFITLRHKTDGVVLQEQTKVLEFCLLADGERRNHFQ